MPDYRNEDAATGDFIVVKALENGVNLIGMTRGRDTRLLHTEKLDAGEVIIAQFTENTSLVLLTEEVIIHARGRRNARDTTPMMIVLISAEVNSFLFMCARLLS